MAPIPYTASATNRKGWTWIRKRNAFLEPESFAFKEIRLFVFSFMKTDLMIFPLHCIESVSEFCVKLQFNYEMVLLKVSGSVSEKFEWYVVTSKLTVQTSQTPCFI